MQDKHSNALAEKPINKLIATFAIPSIISMLVGAIYNMVDQIFIGNGVEEIAMGATTVAFPIVTVCMAWALLCGVGGAANFNLESGRGEHSRARHAMGTSLFMLVSGGIVIMAVVLIFLEPILRVCGATDQLMGYSTTYAGITAFGLPFLILTSGGAHLIRADKSPNFSMAVTLTGAILNTILDPIFIYLFDWGIAGAAWATVIGQVVSSLLVLFYFAKKQKMQLKGRDLIPIWRRAKRILSLGSASCINQLAILVVQVLMNNQLARYGAQSDYGAEIAVTCAGVVSKVSMIFLGIAIGISQGCQPIWSFNRGAGRIDRVRETLRTSSLLCLGLGVVFFLLFQLFPAQIIQMFGVHSPEGIAFSTRYFRIFLFMTFLNGLQPLISGFFTSIGRAKLGIVTSLTRQILFLVPLTLFFPLWWGIDGLMYAGPIADAAAALTAIFFAAREMRHMGKENLIAA